MKNSEYIEKFCTGCGLCHSVQGTPMEIIERGFPNASVAGEEDSPLFRQVCPVFYYEDACRYDVWGRTEQAVVGYSSNPKLRYQASSGGALTELCIQLLADQRVDGIIHTTFDSSSPTKTTSCISYTPEELKERCGSRYSISTPLENIMQMMKEGERYAFVGKPCDVMALRRYMSVSLELKEKIPYLLSFFCAGEPSVDAQKRLLERMGCSVEGCQRLTYRGNGWPGYTTAVDKDGKVGRLEYKVAWGEYLGRDLRNICRFCMDGIGEAADIACADFWYLDQEGKPDFSEHEGRNIIIARTAQGVNLLKASLDSGRIVNEQDYTGHMDEFHLYQPHQYKRKGTMQSMIFAMKLCGRSTPRYHRSYLRQFASHASGKDKLRYFLGIIKRVLKKQI